MPFNIFLLFIFFFWEFHSYLDFFLKSVCLCACYGVINSLEFWFFFLFFCLLDLFYTQFAESEKKLFCFKFLGFWTYFFSFFVQQKILPEIWWIRGIDAMYFFLWVTRQGRRLYSMGENSLNKITINFMRKHGTIIRMAYESIEYNFLLWSLLVS